MTTWLIQYEHRLESAEKSQHVKHAPVRYNATSNHMECDAPRRLMLLHARGVHREGFAAVINWLLLFSLHAHIVMLI